MIHNKHPVILYRKGEDWNLEKDIAQKYFPCVKSRCSCGSKDLVIPRFSALPFYDELEFDLNISGAELINSFEQHRYIADLGNWYWDLNKLTPLTWRNLCDIPEEGPFILKGETNSKKFLWNTHFFAKNKREAIDVYGRLIQDSMLQYQQIYIRKYVPLERLFEGLQGLQITREYRFFVFRDVILSGGFYWSNYVDEIKEKGIYINPDEVPRDFMNGIISKIQNTEISEPPNYYVIDVAKTESGEWILIELNDGSMSGLSENNPDVLYKKLSLELGKL